MDEKYASPSAQPAVGLPGTPRHPWPQEGDRPLAERPHDLLAQDENPAVGHSSVPAYKLVGLVSRLPHNSMDPNYSTHTGPHPWDQPPPSDARPRRVQTVDFAWVQQLRNEYEEQFKERLRCRWQLLRSGPRIRLLRAVTGWTQERAATELGIARRTLIRHEQGQHRRPWMRGPLLFRLRELEGKYADQILAYLDHGGPIQA